MPINELAQAGLQTAKALPAAGKGAFQWLSQKAGGLGSMLFLGMMMWEVMQGLRSKPKQQMVAEQNNMDQMEAALMAAQQQGQDQMADEEAQRALLMQAGGQGGFNPYGY